MNFSSKAKPRLCVPDLLAINKRSSGASVHFSSSSSSVQVRRIEYNLSSGEGSHRITAAKIYIAFCHVNWFPKMAGKRRWKLAKAEEVFGQAQKGERAARVSLYGRVSTHDQQTLPLQLDSMRSYAAQRGWKIVSEIQEVGSGAVQRPKRELLMKSARRRETDIILVWRLDRWGRSVADLAITLKELNELGVAFVSLTEALDLTTPTGRAMAGLLSVFAEFEREVLRERILAGIAQARKKGTPLGRPRTVANKKIEACKLFTKGLSKSDIARRLSISRTSVRRLLS
jgi:DNA invertase Pin-like site-specific DNA recombinase